MELPKRNDPCWCGSGVKFKRCHHPEAPPESAATGASLAAPGRRLSSSSRRGGGLSATALLDRVRPGRVGPARPVPEHIVRPDYANTGEPGAPRGDGSPLPPDQVERLRGACRAARDVLDTVVAAIRPGVTTDELDAIAHEETIRRGGYPSPLNYQGYPKSLCTSVNEVICHGIPDDRALQDGDIVNCDVTVYIDGMHGDNSVTSLVGEVDEESTRLVRVTYEALMLGIEAVRPGGKVADIGRAIERHATAHGFSVARAFVGHGVGEQFHTDPLVPHYYDPDATTELRPGMAFTIEPMLNAGSWEHRLWRDGWTAVTADLKRSAQFEHTVLVTEGGVEILTLPEGEPQPFPH